MAALSGVSAAVDTSTSQALRRSSKGNKQTIGKSSGTKQAVKGKVVAGGMKKLEGKPPKKAMAMKKKKARVEATRVAFPLDTGSRTGSRSDTPGRNKGKNDKKSTSCPKCSALTESPRVARSPKPRAHRPRWKPYRPRVFFQFRRRAMDQEKAPEAERYGARRGRSGGGAQGAQGTEAGEKEKRPAWESAATYAAATVSDASPATIDTAIARAPAAAPAPRRPIWSTETAAESKRAELDRTEPALSLAQLQHAIVAQAADWGM